MSKIPIYVKRTYLPIFHILPTYISSVQFFINRFQPKMVKPFIGYNSKTEHVKHISMTNEDIYDVKIIARKNYLLDITEDFH